MQKSSQLLPVFRDAQEVEAGGDAAGDGDICQGDAIGVLDISLGEAEETNLKYERVYLQYFFQNMCLHIL